MSLYDSLAEAIPKRFWLRCTVCGHTTYRYRAAASTYFSSGWPKCCGYTMRLETKKPAAPPEPTDGEEGK